MVDEKKQTQEKDSSSPKKELKGIIRIAEVDLTGAKLLKAALPKIKGVGYNLGVAVMRKMNLDMKMKSGELTDEQVVKLEEIFNDPIKFGLPAYLVNRRADPETGEDKNILSSKLIFRKKLDIDGMKKIRCYKGVRHELKLPVRGQRTRGSFRTGSKVGVVKKKK